MLGCVDVASKFDTIGLVWRKYHIIAIGVRVEVAAQLDLKGYARGIRSVEGAVHLDSERICFMCP